MVPAAVSAVGRARSELDEDRYSRSFVSGGRGGSPVFAGIQPHEPFGVAARIGRRDFLHARVSGAIGSAGRAGHQWVQGIFDGAFEGAAVTVRGWVGGGDSQSGAGVEGGGGDWFSAGGETEYWWKRGGDCAFFERR